MIDTEDPQHSPRPAYGTLDRVTVGLGMLATGVLALRDLDTRSLWLDESTTAYVVTGSTDRLIDWFAIEPQFAVYHTLLRTWTVFGSTGFTLRLFSVACAVLCVPVVHATARKLFSRRAAALAVVLTACNGMLLGYAQEARPYALVALTSATATLCLVRACEEAHRVRRWALWGVSALLAGLSHPFGATIVLGHLIVMGSRHRSLPLRDIALTFALPAGLLGTLALRLIAIGPDRLHWVPAADQQTYLWIAQKLTGGREPGSLLAATVGITMLAIAVARSGDRRLRTSSLVVGCLVIAPVGCALIISRYQPVIVARYLIVIVTPLAMLVAAGLSRLRGAWAGAVTIACVAVLLPAALSPFREPQQDFRAATSYIRSESRPGDVIVVTPHGLKAIQYYLEQDPRLAHNVRAVAASTYLRFDRPGLQPCRLGQVWFVVATLGTAEQIGPSLAATHVLREPRRFAGVAVSRFDRRSDAPCG